MPHLYHARQRRRAADRKFFYKALIATPDVLTGGVAADTSSVLTLPAGAFLAISYSVSLNANELRANTSRGNQIGTPALAADELYPIGWFEPDVDIDLEITVATAGTATLHHLDEWKLPDAIATAVFT